MMPNRESRKVPAVTMGSRFRHVGAVALKATGWIVAVPALCAAVLVAGAVPLYLLLPEGPPKPVSPAAVETASEGSSTVPDPSMAEDEVVEASLAPEPVPADAPTPADVPKPAATNDAAPPGEEAEEEIAAAINEPVHLGIVPTPRPEIVAALEPKPTGTSARANAVSPATVGTDRVSRAVTLRAGPHGQKLGVLREGTEVAIVQCDGWCEIRSADGDGWIHSSFLAGAARSADRSPSRLAERPRRYESDRREAAREAERRYREDWRRDDPDWMLPDDPLGYADDPREPVYYELEPYPYR